MNKPRVLVVEDDPSAQEAARLALEPYAEVIIAGSVSAALRELKVRSDFSYVILDGFVPRFDNEPLRAGDTTMSLARHIVKRFNIPAYSASSDETLNDELASLGCIRCNKKTALVEVKKALTAFRK